MTHYFSLVKSPKYSDSILLITSNMFNKISDVPETLEKIDIKLTQDLPYISYVKLSIENGIHEIYIFDALRNKQDEAVLYAHKIFECLTLKGWKYVNAMYEGKDVIFDD